MTNKQADIAVIGLAVMGQNLILNMDSHGYSVIAYNRTVEKVDSFLNGAAKGTNIIGAASLKEVVDNLKRPRKIMLMIKAGSAVDSFIEQIKPLLEKGDVIIDGGNSNYDDTIRRVNSLEKEGIVYIGSGISGGEEGARFGPSIMPGGNKEGWPAIENIFKDISAKSEDNAPCCEWIGPEGSGHFVKMIHNGIEYGDMQLIAESYHLLKNICSMKPPQISETFSKWNKTELDSYLIEITADIFTKKDDEGEGYLIDKILDKAGQKGTGKWTSINALNLGTPLSLITESVFARCISAFKDLRVNAEENYKFTFPNADINLESFTEDIREALLLSKIISYSQGFMTIKAASEEFEWNLNLGEIALIWRNGCIIRSTFLNDIKDAYEENPHIGSLLDAPYFSTIVKKAHQSLRRVISTGVQYGVPLPSMSAALSFLDSYVTGYLPANLIQAQRDYFGAHTYERVDRERGQFFHTNWTGKGGDTASSTYNA